MNRGINFKKTIKEILKLKSTITKMKNIPEHFISTFVQTE